MSFLNIPEWEIEEVLIKNPIILGLEKIFKNPKLVDRQFFLSVSDRFIDLLFSTDDNKYVIVELKKNYLDDQNIIFHQLLPYRIDLSKELRIPVSQIYCMVASPKGMSTNFKQLCKEEGIYYKQINEKFLYRFSSIKSKEIKDKHNDYLVYRLFKRRHPTIKFTQKHNSKGYSKIIKSIYNYIKKNEHDVTAKKEIAKLFRNTSLKAPLCAHEVFDSSYEKFINDSQKWFWIFYSVIDRRANAATFIKARKALEDKDLFSPEIICENVKDLGKEETIHLIYDILETSEFPLCSDSTRMELAMPTSIVEAALWYKNYDFSIENVKKTFETRYTNPKKHTSELMRELKENIYGVGKRIAAQIIRGFILKDNWKWRNDFSTMLEKCDFNITFASKARLNLISSNNAYYKDLKAFGDIYLDGNYSIISHTLWYIRKRYCLRPKRCFECPMAGYCNYYYRSLYWDVPEYEITLFDLPNFTDD